MRISDWSSDVCSSDLLAKVAQNFLGDGVVLGDARLERNELLAGIAPDGIDKLVESFWIDCHDQAPSRPTIAIAATLWFGMPQRLCERPKVGEIGREHVCTPVTTEHIVCSLLYE